MSNFTSTEVAVEVLVVVNNSRGSSEFPGTSSDSVSCRRVEDSVTLPRRMFLTLLTEMFSVFAMEVASA